GASGDEGLASREAGGEASEGASGDEGLASREAGGEASEGSLVIWTTTPWTIPANTFTAVDPEGAYVGVRAEKGGEEELLYLAEARHEAVLAEGRYESYEIVEELI